MTPFENAANFVNSLAENLYASYAMMRYVPVIEDLQSEGIRAKITVLPSTTLRQRKSSLGVKRSASRRRSGNTQMQDCNKIYHSSGHN